MPRVAVMGAGAWGSAFALVLADAGNDVLMWSRHPEVAEAINNEHHNPRYLQQALLPDSVRAVVDPAEAMAGADAVVLAIPSQTIRQNLAEWQIPANTAVISLAKGIETGTGRRMSQVIAESGVPQDLIAVVSGPNLADEIAARQPAASVVACTDVERAKRVQRLCLTSSFRPYTVTDVVGCELAGATKNAIALAVGMGVGMGLGANAQASVITRGLAETTRLGEALGADPHTFAGLAGMGDLVATCSSPLSRNRSFGELLGTGHSVAEATEASRGVAEGVRSSASILALAREHGVDMPIVAGVVEVIEGRLAPRAAISALMARELKPERG